MDSQLGSVIHNAVHTGLIEKIDCSRIHAEGLVVQLELDVGICDNGQMES